MQEEPPAVPDPEPQEEEEPVVEAEPEPKMEIVPQPDSLPAEPIKPIEGAPPVAETPPPPPPAPEPTPAKPEIIIEPQETPVSSVKMDDIKDGMELTVDDLDALFRTDKSGTNMKLNSKTIVLKGKVEKVFIRDHLDIRYIVLTGGKKLVWSCRCTFEKDESTKAARLHEGESVSVQAKYDGYGKNIIFKDCQVL